MIVHFTEKMAKKEINQIVGVNYNDFNPWKLHEQIKDLAIRHNKDISEYNCYDTLICYVMALSDYPSSLDSEERRMMWVVEYLTDADGDENKLFNYFYN